MMTANEFRLYCQVLARRAAAILADTHPDVQVYSQWDFARGRLILHHVDFPADPIDEDTAAEPAAEAPAAGPDAPDPGA